MKFFPACSRNRREMNLTTALERQRLGRTMPGQTGAVAGRPPRLPRSLNSDPLSRRLRAPFIHGAQSPALTAARA